MLECLKCKKPLTLSIDAESFNSKCRRCGQQYNLSLQGRHAAIAFGKQKLELGLNDISSCSTEFSKKILYEMYNKGYIKCLKMINSKFNNHDSEWVLPVNEALNISFKWYNDNIGLLSEELDHLACMEQSYMCPSCRASVSFSDAVAVSFLCPTCKKQLGEFKIEDKKKMLEKNILTLKKEQAALFRGWS